MGKGTVVHPILFRLPVADFPVFSYGVMLGLSFVVGWYVSLGLAARDGQPREMLATCYVITAVAALVGSRVLFLITNPDSFDGIADVLAIRSGGMVAYGGFLGGLLGSVGYLWWKKYPILPWGDVGVPSLAVGLFITRVGCYLNGCDFGKPLTSAAPPWLVKLGTFPRWDPTAGAGDGSPAWVQHANASLIGPSAETSLAVHPTQLYESLFGLGLFALLLLARRSQRFRGQIFLLFAFLYGAGRFSLELVRDDIERGEIPLALPPHILLGGSFLLLGLAGAFGVAPIIRTSTVRLGTQVAAFVPAIWLFLATRPAEFQVAVPVKLSTSQLIGLLSAIGAALAFVILHRAALTSPAAAMALPAWREAGSDEDEPANEAEAEDDGDEGRLPKAKSAVKKSKPGGEPRKKTKPKKKIPKKAPTPAEDPG